MKKKAKGWECTECGATQSDNDIHLAPNGDKLCSSCFQDKCFICEDCGDAHDLNSSHKYNGSLYCEECFDESYFTCGDCGEAHDRDVAYDTDYNLYCPDCFHRSYFICAGCETTQNNDNAYQFRGDDYCESCYADRSEDNSTIKSYSYRPEPILSKLSYENTAYLGVELEILTENDPTEYAEKIQDDWSNFAYFKEDGSLDDEGFEIVTHPATLLYHKKHKWYDRLKKLKKDGCISYTDAKCGIHVHVNKAALSRRDWWKVVMFFSQENAKKKIIKFSQRTEEQIDRWCKFRSLVEYGCDGRRDLFSHTLQRHPRDRDRNKYIAINFNQNTVEFRIFRGTLDYKRFLATLQFVDALISFVHLTGTAFFKFNVHKNNSKMWNLFKEFISKSGQYKILRDYLKSKKL